MKQSESVGKLLQRYFQQNITKYDLYVELKQLSLNDNTRVLLNTVKEIVEELIQDGVSENKIRELRSRRQQYLDNIILNSIEQDKFIPFYQGIRDNKTGEIKKYEVLSRVKINDKTYSISNYIYKLSNLDKLPIIMMIIIEKALIKLKESPDIDFSFNFTQSELNTLFIEWFIEKLKEFDINPQRIIIELVETPYNDDNLEEIVKRLKQIGFKIAIDDFGTGYNNLKRLLQVSPDFLKIDSSLIYGISKNKEQLDIVKTFLEITKILKAEVIAEGVDNIEDQNTLEILKVRYTQGYLYSQPTDNF